ncbi:hypothetical protein DVA81_18845, partial [Acinetobacter baumannii]
QGPDLRVSILKRATLFPKTAGHFLVNITQTGVNSVLDGDYFQLQITVSIFVTRTVYVGSNQSRLQCVFIIMKEHVSVAHCCVFNNDQ